MKKHLLFLLLAFFISGITTAQTKSIPDTLVIFGADFSLARIVTKHAYNPHEILEIDIPRVNSEMVKTCQGFITKFQANHLIFDSTDVKRINAARNKENFFTDKRFIFSGGDSIVRQVLKNYNTKGYTNGAGMLFVMEKVDEINDRESFYILMFDLNTKKIIHCDKIETGLSAVKNKFSAGWFSWKTGIYRTLEEMDDVYDFWNNYPENEPIDIHSGVPDKINYKSALKDPKKENQTNKGTGIKNKKMIFFYGSISLIAEYIRSQYEFTFEERYMPYEVLGTFSVPKLNLSFDYGFSRKHSLGITIGMDKGDITWRDSTVNNNAQYYKDSWTRYQVTARYHYHFVALPFFSIYSGPQIGYNYHKQTSSDSNNSIVKVKPFPVSAQINVGANFFIKKHIGIGLGGSLGFGGNDMFWMSLGYKF